MRATLLTKPPLGSTLAHGHPFTRGLLARFLFNEGAGVRLNNLAPGGHDAILTNMDAASAWIPARGGALAFDGTNDYAVAAGIKLDGLTRASLSIWFRTGTAPGGGSTLLSTSVGGVGISLRFSDATHIQALLAFSTATFAVTYNDNLWHNVVTVANGGDVVGEQTRLYYDGRLVAISSSAPDPVTPISAPSNTLWICSTEGASQFTRADIADVRVYDRDLGPDEIAALYADPWADTHRPLWVFPDRSHTKRELEGYIGGDWRNLTQDMLLNPDLSIEYGISGTSPTDRVAGAGSMSWAMNNSQWNSALTLGRYSPDHASRLAGFTQGMPVRFTYRGISGAVYRKHVGWLASIDPDPFIEEDRRVRCRSADWMAEAGIFTPSGIAIQVEQTADQVATALLNGTARRPVGTRFDVGKVVFPYAPDNSRSGEQPILGEFQSLAMSEWGYFYLLGDGTLRFENQTARLVPTIKASFSNTIASLRVGQSRGRIKNVVKVTVHPRRADDNDNVVLYQLPAGVKAPFVPAGQELNLNGRYNDPTNRQVRVAGINMQAPVPLTDYNMFHNANGGGASMAANFDVTAAFGANDVKLKIKSNAAQGGYVTKLQTRGRGLYDYDPYDVEARDEASIALYGVSELKIDMPYNADPIVAQAVANYVLGQFSDPITADASLSVIAGDPVTEELVMSIEPGDAITAQETLTGINFVFFVQHVSYRMPEDGITMAEFLLQRGPLSDYWTLGVAGKGELGQTTVVAPL